MLTTKLTACAIVPSIVLFAHVTSFSQLDHKKAVENPFSTAIYLLSTTDKDDKNEEKACLANSLASVNRFADVQTVANMVRQQSYVDDEFVAIAQELVSKGKIAEASAFVSYLLKRFEDDDGYHLKEIIRPLILLKRETEIGPLVEKLNDSDKVDLSFEVAGAYTELHRPERALETLSKIVPLVETSKYPEDKAMLAFCYAKLGKEEEALRFARLALDSLEWRSGKPEYTEGRVIDRCIEAYKLLGKRLEALELLTRQGKAEEVNELVDDAEQALSRGDRTKVFEYIDRSLASLDSKEYDDSFGLGKIVEIYLKLGETTKAEMVARNISGNEYMRQKKLLAVADHLTRMGMRSRAYSLLQFALEKTNKIDIREKEEGRLSTSNKWNQAGYQSQIAIRLINMRFDKEALTVISKLKKPYLRALILTDYVAANKDRPIAREKLASFLEEAVLLLRLKQVELFDSRKIDVFAITARNFAQIGMTKRANEVFTETLTKLDSEMIDRGTESSVIFAMCNIGIEFERSNIKADEGLKAALRRIVDHWENGEY